MMGAVLGSFAACMVRRLREKEQGREIKERRSVCLNCGARINWQDNIPVWSWLRLRGRCRKCGAKIGVMEIMMEVVGLALGLIAAANLMPMLMRMSGGDLLIASGMVLVGVALTVALMILVAYDLKWQVMPSFLLTFSIICAIIISLGGVFMAKAPFLGAKEEKCSYGAYMRGECGVRERKELPRGDEKEEYWKGVMRRAAVVVLAVVVLAGPYFAIYWFSKERMVGGGDYLLAIALALVLGHPVTAFLAMLIANVAGSAVAVPMFLTKKIKRVPMAPFLVLGFLVVVMLNLLMPGEMMKLTKVFEMMR